VSYRRVRWSDVDLNDLAALSDVLESILEGAAAADSTRVAETVLEDLEAFIEKSPPLLEGTRALDDVARRAKPPLRRAIIEKSLEAIEAASSEYAVLMKDVVRIRAEMDKQAATLRLTKAHCAVDALAHAVRAVEDLDKVLAAESDDALRARLLEGMKALEGLKKLIERQEG